MMENYLNNTDFERIRETLDKSGRIIITTHTNPDGDAIGASLAMFLYLCKRGGDVKVIIPDLYPEFLAWLPKAQEMAGWFQQEGLLFPDSPWPVGFLPVILHREDVPVLQVLLRCAL